MLKHYFAVLESTGYYRHGDVAKMIVYLFIVNELLDGEYSDYVTEDDYSTIFDAAQEKL